MDNYNKALVRYRNAVTSVYCAALDANLPLDKVDKHLDGVKTDVKAKCNAMILSAAEQGRILEIVRKVIKMGVF